MTEPMPPAPPDPHARRKQLVRAAVWGVLFIVLALLLWRAGVPGRYWEWK
ncbi:hypothetical protein [Mycolicibacterium sphagni]|nr:hypothetical protein [Mycolicibacterium sphagni]MCV7174786.1 hypothetical protein [Mycolicibacterium sphagni]